MKKKRVCRVGNLQRAVLAVYPQLKRSIRQIIDLFFAGKFHHIGKSAEFVAKEE